MKIAVFLVYWRINYNASNVLYVHRKHRADHTGYVVTTWSQK